MKFHHRLKFLIVYLCFSLTLKGQSQELKYLQYDKDQIPPQEFKSRRDSLMKLMTPGSVGVFYSGPERQRNGDVNFLYHQDENFFYLTGFNEPNAILILIPAGISLPGINDTGTRKTTREILFVQKREPDREQWTGRTFGPEGAMSLAGLDYALTNDQLERICKTWVFKPSTKGLYFTPIPEDINPEMKDLLKPIRDLNSLIDSRHLPFPLLDPRSLLYHLRAIKSPAEILLIRKATEISALAHREAMKSVEPGMFEYQLQGIYEYVYHRKGSEYTGYPCIVGSGENSVILHYESNRKQILDGDIINADCAAEYHNYSSDITRSYPASGHFSKAQKEIYDIVLKAQNACISMVNSGTSWKDVQLKSEEIITDGLYQLGIIKEKTYSQMRRFYMHGVGHSVGLNVHDAGVGNLNGILKPGMIYTVEPGIYIKENAEGVDPKYYNIGIRIEDCILVTENGHEILSAAAPREIKDIEALMKKKGIGNMPIE